MNKKTQKQLNDYIALMNKRHSSYELADSSILSDDELIDFINECLFTIPSAFNYQTQRVMLLLNDNHKKLWEITSKHLPESTKPRMEMFAKAYASILFFIDENQMKEAQKMKAEFAPLFPKWEEDGNAMLQFKIWAGLCSIGYGVNLQHYNPLIDKDVQQAFNVPKHWRLVAQMVIGEVNEDEPHPQYHDVNNRFLVRK